MDQDAVGPAIEAGRIAQLWQRAPDLDKCLLGCILGQVAVAQDPIGDLLEPATGSLRDSGNRDFVPPLRSHDESGVHVLSVAGT